jgi:hypothetical protein
MAQLSLDLEVYGKRSHVGGNDDRRGVFFILVEIQPVDILKKRKIHFLAIFEQVKVEQCK